MSDVCTYGNNYQDFILKAGNFILLLRNCLKHVHFKFEVKRLKRCKVKGKYEILDHQLFFGGNDYLYFIAKAGNFLLLVYNCEKRVYLKFETEYKTRHNHEIISIFIFQ